MVVAAQTHRWTDRSHLHSKPSRYQGVPRDGAGTGTFVYGRPCIESTAGAVMRQSLHLKSRGMSSAITIAAALRRLKPGKSPRLDSIFPVFILHAGSGLKSWFCDFLTSCMRQLNIPKIRRRALVVAFPKPEKPLGDPKSYRRISLQCVPLQILERLISARVEPIIDPLLPQEQAGFRHGSSAVDQADTGHRDWLDCFLHKVSGNFPFVSH